jgi:putative hydrolase of the HAD superfamily
MIRALIFDCDGLVVDTESAVIEAYAQVYQEHGIPFDRERFNQNAGHADYTFDPWYAFDKHADRAALEADRQKRNRLLNGHLPLLPGVLPLLEGARRAGLRLGMASNSSHAHVEGQINRLGVRDFFEFVACREDASSPKPEPDLYRVVINRFGLRGIEAVALEDSQTGITSAKRAGLWAVAVPGATTAHQDFSLADLRLHSLAETTVESLAEKFSRAPGEAGRGGQGAGF